MNKSQSIIESLSEDNHNIYVWEDGEKRKAVKSDWKKTSLNKMKKEIEEETGADVTLVEKTPQTSYLMVGDELLGVFDHDEEYGIISTSE